MAKTKTKKAKNNTFDLCPLRVREESVWEKHVVECGRKRGQNGLSAVIAYATNKKNDMSRRCGRAMSDTLKLTARVKKTGSSLIPELSRMLWVKQLLKLFLGWQRRIQRHLIPSTLQRLMNKRYMMQVAPAPFKHPMTTLRGNVLSATGPTSMQDCSVRVYLSSNGVNESTQTLRCEQVEHTTQTEGQNEASWSNSQKDFCNLWIYKDCTILFCFLYCL